jgi:FAD dependent oxidoreductase TIGR03364
LAKRGLRVVVLERHARAEGASIRNFGMIWPIGQPAGALFEQACRSREIWAALGRDAGFFMRETGSLHLAHREDEAAVLEEFARVAPDLGVAVKLLSPVETLERSSLANPVNLLCSLWSGVDMCVDPREAIGMLPGFLTRTHGIEFHVGCPVVRVDKGAAVTADGRIFRAPRIVVCTGEDLRTLFPEAYADSGIRRCKLQMLRTVPQPTGWSPGPMIASGLTLRHYAIFQVCPSLRAVKERVARETPELDRFGIHVMASQHRDGGMVLGDSHEYGSDITPFDQAVIDELILRELRPLVRLPRWQIAERWHGVYPKHSTLSEFIVEPAPGVVVMNALGGAGMTRSFAVAEDFWKGRLAG